MDSPLTALLLIGLATYRLARLLVYEDGPGDVVLRLRAWAGCYDYGEDGRPVSSLGRALTCVHCSGVYLGSGLFALFLFAPVVVFWLAALGLASLLFEVTQ